jgi:hypothetical protein
MLSGVRAKDVYEHRKSLTSFLYYFMIASAVGLLSGALLDFAATKVRGEKKRWKCALTLTGQIVVVGVIFYILFKLSGPKLFFDDWMMSTFSGFIFALTFFGAQTSLSENINCAIE